jgi:hypothetical protein
MISKMFSNTFKRFSAKKAPSHSFMAKTKHPKSYALSPQGLKNQQDYAFRYGGNGLLG